MDVVPADASRWSVPPFAGVVKDGLIYGRGAEDMKTEGILQLLALVRLKREGVSLDRDVLFLATADEEADFAGALRALSPGVPVTTKMLTGATECVLYRPLGITCYGFTPLLTTAEETSTAHGDDERVSEATVRRSTGIFYEVVREIAGRR